ELAATNADRTGALAAKAATLRRAGRPDEALEALRESAALDPSRTQNKASYTSLVATLRELDRLDEARLEGEALLALHTDDSWVPSAVGRVYKALFDRDDDPTLLGRAESCYRRAAELQPGDRNIVKELRSLIARYDALAEALGSQEPAERARGLER